VDESAASQVTERLRERRVMAHVASTGLYRYGIRVVIADGREALWDADGTAGIEAQILRDGILTGFVPKLPGSEDWDVDQIVEAIATTDYDDPNRNATGSIGEQERPPVGQRGGIRETRPRTGRPAPTGGTLDRWKRRFGMR
jgi:hypothetical protein